MTSDDIIRMAREAELIRDDSTASRWLPGTDLYPELNVFAALVAAAEREACAQIADAEASIEGIAQRIAAAIRARGNT